MKKLKKKHPLYDTWNAMKQRCYNPNNNDFHNYGGRGITVCQRWLDDFWNFVEDMGDRPDGHSIDRIENDQGYSPDNCKWSTSTEQVLNRTFRSAKGYSWDKNSKKWMAQYRRGDRRVYIGLFDCPLIAHLAYKDAIANEKTN